jgi:hypothetical protein
MKFKYEVAEFDFCYNMVVALLRHLALYKIANSINLMPSDCSPKFRNNQHAYAEILIQTTFTSSSIALKLIRVIDTRGILELTELKKAAHAV